MMIYNKKEIRKQENRKTRNLGQRKLRLKSVYLLWQINQDVKSYAKNLVDLTNPTKKLNTEKYRAN